MLCYEHLKSFSILKKVRKVKTIVETTTLENTCRNLLHPATVNSTQEAAHGQLEGIPILNEKKRTLAESCFR